MVSEVCGNSHVLAMRCTYACTLYESFAREPWLTVYNAPQVELKLCQNYLWFLVGLFLNFSRCVNSFWLRLFHLLVLLHVYVLEMSRHSRKFIVKDWVRARLVTWYQFLVSRTSCEVLKDFRVGELISSMLGVHICIQCTKLYRLMYAMVDFVVFHIFAILDVRCNSGHILVSYFHHLVALRALSGKHITLPYGS